MNEIKFAQVTGLTSPNPLTLVCTKKEDGTTNLSTISWWMPLSFNTVSEIMLILDVGIKAVYGLIHQKAFPAIRIYNAGYRIPKDTFHAWLYKMDQ